jgi:hypothetical protein
MAGEWVKMRHSLLTSPKVLGIARAIGASREAGKTLTTGFSGPPQDVLSRNALRNVTVTALLAVWASANEHSRDGTMHHCDLDDLDEIAGIPGFGRAMESVGWASYDEETISVSLPNFAEWNAPASDRTNAERQRRYREKAAEPRNGGVTLRNAVTVTTEKRGDEEMRGEVPPPPREAAPWESLRTAWNAGKGRPWKPREMPDGTAEALATPGWYEQALEAIQRIPRCRYFRNPPTLIQFVKPGFVAKINGGAYDDVTPKKRDGDDRPMPRVDPEWEERKRLTIEKLQREGRA